jgi:hypothetical protein
VQENVRNIDAVSELRQDKYTNVSFREIFFCPADHDSKSSMRSSINVSWLFLNTISEK